MASSEMPAGPFGFDTNVHDPVVAIKTEQMVRSVQPLLDAEKRFSHAINEPLYLGEILHLATSSLRRVADAIKEGRPHSFWLRDMEEGNPLMDYHREGIYILTRILKTPEATLNTLRQNTYKEARRAVITTFVRTALDMSAPQVKMLYKQLGLEVNPQTNRFQGEFTLRRVTTLQ